MNNSKRFKAIDSFFSLLGVYSLVATVVVLASVSNAVNAVVEYDTEFLEGFSTGFAVMCSMALIGMAIVVVGIYGANYNLLCVIPLKTSTVPAQMVAVIDITHLMCAVLDIFVMCIAGAASAIPIKLIQILTLYIMTQITLYATTNPGLAQNIGANGFKGARSIVWFILYIAGVIVVMVTTVLVYEGTDFSTPVKLAVTGALAVGAVVTRILVYKGIKNKVRLIKNYKEKKKKKIKEVSYV